jgi:poly(A) polymerase
MQTIETVAAELAPVAQKFVDSGFAIYLVGGAVRDLLLEQREAVDFDLTTDATPEQTKRIVKPLADALWTQGERFGTIGCIVAGRDYEITTHRGEFYTASSRKPKVRFSTDVEADLSRRDFTVNAMAVSLPDLRMVDPFNGQDDLESQVLRTPLSPQISFTDDPLRMLRAARFVSGYGLEPMPELVAAMSEFAARLGIVSAERIRDELLKLFALEDPEPGLALLATTGVLSEILPEAAARPDWDDALRASVLAEGAVVRLAVLLASETPEVAAARMSAMRATNDEVALVRMLVASTPTLSRESWSDQDVRELYFSAAGNLDATLSFWNALGSADSELLEGRKKFMTAVARIATSEDLSDFTTPLDGQQVMDLLGIAPGKQVGEALAMLRSEHLRSGPVSASQAESLLRAWHASSENAE